jgi:bacterioferritin-associated ferredoxin
MKMDNEIDPRIMDNITKVCICKAIPRSKIKEAIRKGADSVVKVNEVTGSGSGECRGRRCGLKIKALVDGYKNGEWE